MRNRLLVSPPRFADSQRGGSLSDLGAADSEMRIKGLTAIGRLLLILAFVVAGQQNLCAAPTPQQRTKANSAESLIKKAARQFQAKKFQEAGDTLGEAQKLLSELESEDDPKQVLPLTAALRKSIAKAQGQLAAEGITLPQLAPPPAPGAAVAPAGKISFTKQVTPVLVSKCGRCHVDRSSGAFSMSTYAELMKGSKDGVVLFAGKGKTSRMIELIEQQDMPRGGGTVAPEELALLIKWIDEGATFDGKDPAARLVPAGTPAGEQQPAVAVVQATGKEDVLFSRDIGPVLVASCIGCHGDLQPRAGLGLDTFARMLRGGESGAPITPGNPTGSLIMRKLRGTSTGNRMPQGKPPLSDETIAIFEKWIAGGAKFDAPDPAQPVADVVAIYKARMSTHEELTHDRVALAAKIWHLAMPDMPTDRAETDHFLVYGSVGLKELEEIGRLAEEQVAKIEKTLKAPSISPFIKGRLTIYAFQKHYDYGEIGTMIERREIPTESHGHWRYTIVDAYACVVPPKSGEYSLAALLCQQIASVYVGAGAGRASRNGLPKDRAGQSPPGSIPKIRWCDNRTSASCEAWANAPNPTIS